MFVLVCCLLVGALVSANAFASGLTADQAFVADAAASGIAALITHGRIVTVLAGQLAMPGYLALGTVFALLAMMISNGFFSLLL